METVPDAFDMHAISAKILSIESVDYIGQIHIWSLSPEKHVCSLHIDVLRNRPFADVLKDIRRVFTDLKIDRVTVQPHFVDEPLIKNTERFVELEEGHGEDELCQVCVRKASAEDVCCD